MAWSQNSKLQRYKYYLKTLFEIYRPKCCFCKQYLNPEGFYPKLSGSNLDPFVVHHNDENHDNNDPKNLKFAHRSCHTEHNWKKPNRKNGGVR